MTAETENFPDVPCREEDGCPTEVAVLRREWRSLRTELERERLRLAACGVVALANTADSAERARMMHDDYRSASCDDVARAVDAQMTLRAALTALDERLKECANIPASAADAYDDFYRDMVADALGPNC